MNENELKNTVPEENGSLSTREAPTELPPATAAEASQEPVSQACTETGPSLTPPPSQEESAQVESFTEEAPAQAPREKLQFSSPPPQETGFSPYSNSGYYPPQQPPAAKKKSGWKVAMSILAVIAILAVGALGGFFLKDMTSEPAPLPQESEEATTENQPAVTPDPLPETEEPVFVPDDNENADDMNAREIYASNVNSVVGVRTAGQKYNVFGSVSAYASSGTGFIIKENGYILTNAHVVQDEELTNPEVTVTLYNGETFTAKVVGFDEQIDVALLKIEAEGLTPVTLGDSDKLVAGEGISIIGHPLGELSFSISRGIVSAVNREISVENNTLEMFQIDAAVNSGNSGGPAFNENGQVVGIVTSKYASSSIEGLGFCIPVNNALKVANDILNYGFVRGKAAMGVTISNVYTQNGFYQQNFGAQVQSVNKGSAAEKAGVQKGDIIIGIGDTRVTTVDALNNAKSAYKAGDTATLTLYRDGEEVKVEITFDEMLPEELQQTPSKS